MAATFQDDGIEVVPGVFAPGECDELIRAIAASADPGRKSAGLRNLLQNCPRVAEAASDPRITGLVQSRLEREVFPVRVLFFDKNEAANWSVPWHQDLLIPVAERIEAPGFGPWSVKAGVIHVQPPCEVLERMATVRLHLDDCDEDNGALRILPGSHARGILSDAEVSRWKDKGEVVCSVGKGGVLLMRPLVLHASSPAAQPRHRRVVHIEYASGDLPAGLHWFEPG